MTTKFFITSAFLGLNLACGSPADTNNNAALNRNTNTPANVGVLLTPIPEITATPLITENNSSATPTNAPAPTPVTKNPGARNQQPKPAATPASNIPDAETLRRQMQRPTSNSNVSRDPNDGMMMKRSNSNGGSMMKRSSNVNQ